VDFIYRLLVPLSLLGLFLCAVWHIAALVGHPAASMDGGAMGMPLFVGIFLVWFPTMWRLRKIHGAMQSWNGMWVVLEGLEPWLKWSVLIVFAYAFINFFRGFGADMTSPEQSSIGFARIASGHAMFFYAAAAALNRAHERRSDLGIWQCPKGHCVTPKAKFCEECGAPIVKSA
jgi:hypothetical protein